MVSKDESIDFPELVFGVAGPIGVDIDSIVKVLTDELYKVRYSAKEIRITKLMERYRVPGDDGTGNGHFDEISRKIEHGNKLCEKYGPDALARIGILEIINIRKALLKKLNDASPDKEISLPQNVAYIVRQLKRPQEVDLLRKVYGKQFLLISAYGSEEERKHRLQEKIRNSASTLMLSSEIAAQAERLVERDASEVDETGQQLRETFHMADMFIDGVSKQKMTEKLERFVQAFFGRLDIAPSKDEYGMYAAKSASLRSTDLSRQVGAAIFTDDGELITQGCNEVPKALGGTYWDLEIPDHRDIKMGFDPNHSARNHLLRDLFERLQNGGLLSEKATKLGSPAEIVKSVTSKRKDPDAVDGALVGARVMDLTEFGRIVHAEMCAICDAARLGRTVRHSTLFCTTFPCHNCAKHIVASGIKRVVYMEPYPKSLAKQLYENEICIEEEDEKKVSFVPFIGISPSRYRDIFQKSKRKNGDGTARVWIENSMRPMVEVSIPSYPEAEELACGMFFTDYVPTKSN